MILYRILLSLAAPILLIRAALSGGLAERLGQGGPEAARRGSVLWLHGASNGELTAARPLIEALLEHDPKLSMLVTCNSATGRALINDWALPRVTARFAPLDLRFALRRFLASWQPEGLIIVENELWPNRILMMRAMGRPVMAVSARMSPRSARRWKRLPSVAMPVMGALRFLSAQDSASAARFAELGLPDDRIGPALNLKSLIAAPRGVDKSTLKALQQVYNHADTVLAASTHEGEERVILRGFAQALSGRPALRLILAPRHPRRRDEIITLLDRQRLNYAVRSRGEAPGPDTHIYLADTLGEMPLWYRLAGISFVGGSLVPKGGHTPFEPVALGSALAHGSHLENFADVYAALQAGGGAVQIDDADQLAQFLVSCDASTQAELAERARTVVADLRPSAGIAPLVHRITALLA